MVGNDLFIFDTDAGVDDAGAMVLALAQKAEKTTILAVTTVAGNVLCDQAISIVSSFLRVMKITDVGFCNASCITS